ncbi:hypothetical protein V8C37DRAFT_399467 [Trichoderma ceciliae]
MSIREKLLAGVSFGFAETQKQHQQNAAHNRQTYTLVASLQQVIDDAFRVSPSIRRVLKDASQSETMMLPEKEEEELWEQATSRRLQAVMRLANDNPFVPPAGTLDGQRPGENLRLFLQSACRKHGYRKLQLGFLGFLIIKVSNDFRGEPLGPVPMPAREKLGDSLTLDAKGGSLTFYESDVPLASYEQPRHFPAPDMSEEQEAWAILAIPKSQIETVEDRWHPCQNPGEETKGDYIMESVMPHYVRHEIPKSQKGRRAVAFRYSRDGVPGMASSKKPGDVDSAWFEFRTDFDDTHWEIVQAAMTMNSCLVHGISKLDAEWIRVAPEQPEQPKQSKQHNGRKSTTKRAAAHSARKTKRSLSLKHEIHSDD